MVEKSWTEQQKSKFSSFEDSDAGKKPQIFDPCLCVKFNAFRFDLDERSQAFFGEFSV